MKKILLFFLTLFFLSNLAFGDVVTDGAFDNSTAGSDLLDAETLGSDLVTNGSFTSDTTSWSAGAGATLSCESGGQSGNCLRITENGTVDPYAYQNLTTEAGKTYVITFYTKRGTGTNFSVTGLDGLFNIIDTAEVDSGASWTARSIYFIASTTLLQLKLIAEVEASSGEYIDIDEVVVKEVTAASRGSMDGLVGGSSEEFTTPDCSADTFTEGTNWAYNGVNDRYDGTGATGDVTEEITTSGIYVIQWKVQNYAGGSLRGIAGTNYGVQSLSANGIYLDYVYDASGAGTAVGIDAEAAFTGGLDDIYCKKAQNSFAPLGTAVITLDDDGNWGKMLKVTVGDNAAGARVYLKDAADLTADLTPGCLYYITLDAMVDTGDTVKWTIYDGAGTAYTSANIAESLTSYNCYFNAKSATGAYLEFADGAAGEIVWIENITFNAVTLDSWTEGSGFGLYATGGAKGAKAFCYNPSGTLQDVTNVTAGLTYQVIYTIADYSGSDSIVPNVGGTAGTGVSANGTYQENIIAGDTTPLTFSRSGAAGITCTIDTVSCTQVAAASSFTSGFGSSGFGASRFGASPYGASPY